MQIVSDYYRKPYLNFFKDMQQLHYSITWHQDVTAAHKYAKKRKVSFYAVLCYLYTRSMIEIDDFLYRLADPKDDNSDIIKVNSLDTRAMIRLKSAAVKPGMYSIAETRYTETLKKYLDNASDVFARAEQNLQLSDELKHNNYVFFSAISKIPFSSLTHPVKHRKDVIPRVSFGEFKKKSKKVIMPVSIQVNHLFIDGAHLELLYEISNIWLRNPEVAEKPGIKAGELT